VGGRDRCSAAGFRTKLAFLDTAANDSFEPIVTDAAVHERPLSSGGQSDRGHEIELEEIVK
jgi:hypothetical protein